MASVTLTDVSRVFPDGTRALWRVDLGIADGELLVVTGPSGSGKSTVLRVVAGLDPVSSGSVHIDGQEVTNLPPRGRDVAMVLQDAGLYPHLTVAGNMGFGLKVHGVPRDEVGRRVSAEARVLGLQGQLRRLPRTLSAGHRRRAALGRATTRVPRVFLLDEPLVNLDAAERTRVRAELVQLQKGLGVTTVHVTHDQSEALAMGDRVAVLRDGQVQQVATPAALLDRPVNRFVAEFVGFPDMRFVEAAVTDEAGLSWLVVGSQRLRIPGGLPGPLRRHVGRRVLVGLRAHLLRDAGSRPDCPVDRRLRGTVTRVERMGHADIVGVRVEGSELSALYPPYAGPRGGAPVELAVDTAGVQIFDPVTEAAIWHGRGV